MTTATGVATNDVHIGGNFHNLDDIQPRSYHREYQHQGTGNSDSRQTSTFGRFKCCSQQCLIGLGIGLAVGVLLVIIIAVPVGVTKKSSLGTISSTPNWIGTFQMDDACDTSTCCCISNQVKLSKTSDNQMQITGSLVGQCGSIPSTISLTEPMPTSFQAFLTLYGASYRFQLGQDSSYISDVNLIYPYCSASALRTSYNAGNMKSMNLGLVMFILSITIGVMGCE